MRLRIPEIPEPSLIVDSAGIEWWVVHVPMKNDTTRRVIHQGRWLTKLAARCVWLIDRGQ